MLLSVSTEGQAISLLGQGNGNCIATSLQEDIAFFAVLAEVQTLRLFFLRDT